MERNIGAQFFTIRDYLKTPEDFDFACKRVAEIGYKTVQISGSPLDAKVMKPILDNYGLKVVTTHKGYEDFKNNLEEVIEYNRILGSDLCGLGAGWDFVMTNEDDCKEFIELVNKVCYTLKKENMYFGYHNHSKEFVKDLWKKPTMKSVILL